MASFRVTSKVKTESVITAASEDLAIKCHQPKKDDGRGIANFVLTACENSNR